MERKKSLLTLLETRVPNDNMKLFAKHGPIWMLAYALVERLPYKTGAAFLSSYVAWKLGH